MKQVSITKKNNQDMHWDIWDIGGASALPDMKGGYEK